MIVRRRLYSRRLAPLHRLGAWCARRRARRSERVPQDAWQSQLCRLFGWTDCACCKAFCTLPSPRWWRLDLSAHRRQLLHFPAPRRKLPIVLPDASGLLPATLSALCPQSGCTGNEVRRGLRRAALGGLCSKYPPRSHSDLDEDANCTALTRDLDVRPFGAHRIAPPKVTCLLCAGATGCPPARGR
jgi:hypothetical protein